MVAQRLLVCRNSFRKLQARADQRRVVRVAQRIMRGPARLDLHDLQRRFQRLLVARAVGLRIENELRVVPPARPIGLHAVHGQILPEHRDIVKAPRQNGDVLAAPCAELLDRLSERDAVLPQDAVADAGELGHLAVHFFEVFRPDQHLKFIADLLILAHAHRADLHDLAAHRAWQRLPRRAGTRPRLIPFHIQNDVLHTRSPSVVQRLSYHTRGPM